MPVERSGTSIIDVLDRVLDKGIVIDAWVRVSLVGIDLITVEARVVVASIATYLQNSDSLAQAAAVAEPARLFAGATYHATGQAAAAPAAVAAVRAFREASPIRLHSGARAS
jgi:hypothetical protein